MFSSRLQLLRQDPRSFLQRREKVNSNLDALDTVGFGAQSPDDSKPHRPHSPMDTELDVMTVSGESVSDQITYLDAISFLHPPIGVRQLVYASAEKTEARLVVFDC